MNPTPAIQVNGLSYRYPDGTAALADVSLTVQPGEKVALLGPNGAGKSTLMLHLNGLLPGGRHDRSEAVRVLGLTVKPANFPRVRQAVGLVFANPDDQLFCPTVRQDVAFGPRNLGLDRDRIARRTAEALSAVGLTDAHADRSPFRLSLGEKRRAAIATVLAMQPQVLVLDEPTANLDPRGRRQIANLLATLPQTQMLITHDLLLAKELCPRSILLSAGRVVADGPTGDILGDVTLLKTHGLV